LEVVERNLGNDCLDRSEMETLQQLALSVQIGFNPDHTSTTDAAIEISTTAAGSIAA